MASILKVNTIQDATNSTTAMTVDTSGRILTPARPAFRARIAGSSGATGTNGTLVFETEDYDIGSNYDTSNGRFTAPIAGVYWFSFDSLIATNTSGGVPSSTDEFYVDFQKNGTSVAGARTYAKLGSSTQYTIYRIDVLSLSASDYITVNVGSEFAFSSNEEQYDPVFQGYLLG